MRLADLNPHYTISATLPHHEFGLGGLGLIGFHYRVIQADEEEEQVFLLTFNSWPTVRFVVLVAP